MRIIGVECRVAKIDLGDMNEKSIYDSHDAHAFLGGSLVSRHSAKTCIASYSNYILRYYHLESFIDSSLSGKNVFQVPMAQ
jgi:hypothetical protein